MGEQYLINSRSSWTPIPNYLLSQPKKMKLVGPKAQVFPKIYFDGTPYPSHHIVIFLFPIVMMNFFRPASNIRMAILHTKTERTGENGLKKIINKTKTISKERGFEKEEGKTNISLQICQSAKVNSENNLLQCKFLMSI